MYMYICMYIYISTLLIRTYSKAALTPKYSILTCAK